MTCLTSSCAIAKPKGMAKFTRSDAEGVTPRYVIINIINNFYSTYNVMSVAISDLLLMNHGLMDGLTLCEL